MTMNILVGPAVLKDSQTQNLGTSDQPVFFSTTLSSSIRFPESDLDTWPPEWGTSP